MTQAAFHFRRLALRALCVFLPAIYFCVPSATYAADLSSADAAATSAAQFEPFRNYAYGLRESVAVHSSGLILEFHESQLVTEAILYRVGQFTGTGVIWSESHPSGANGYWPTIAISKEGYVVVVHTSQAGKNGADLYYQIGKINPYAGPQQTIMWLTDFIHWDAGYNSSIAINDNGVIVGVHEAGRGGDGLYYRVGHLRNPAGGDYTIQWDSTPWGVRYDTGVNPSIALNNLNEVVQAHQVPGETLLHYRRGTVSGGAIYFGESKRYDNHATQPEVALLDSGLVLEFHTLGGLISRTGSLSPSNAQEIEWDEPIKLDDYQHIATPAVAATRTFAIATYLRNGSPGPVERQLNYSVAIIR
jgi:hypothetical protein